MLQIHPITRANNRPCIKQTKYIFKYTRTNMHITQQITHKSQAPQCTYHNKRQHKKTNMSVQLYPKGGLTQANNHKHNIS